MELLTIGELSTETGVAASALRYYEDLGLLAPATRVSGRRRYDANAVTTVGLVCFLRDVGFTLAEIADLMQADPKDREIWRALAHRKMSELDELIERATTARTALDHALNCPHDHLGDCPTFWQVVEDHRAVTATRPRP